MTTVLTASRENPDLRVNQPLGNKETKASRVSKVKPALLENLVTMVRTLSDQPESKGLKVRLETTEKMEQPEKRESWEPKEKQVSGCV